MTNEEKKKKKKEELYEYVDKHYLDIHRRTTDILSNTFRKLAFAEGAICWLLINSSNLFSTQIKFILAILILFFIFDGLQYFLLSNGYNKLSETYNNQITKGDIKSIDKLVTSPKTDEKGRLFFILKIITLGISTILLISVMFSQTPNHSTSTNAVYIELTAK